MSVATEKTIVLVQLRTGHEPDTWEDVVLPKDKQHYDLTGTATVLRILKGEGTYRLFDRRGELHIVHILSHTVTRTVVTVNGVECEEAGS